VNDLLFICLVVTVGFGGLFGSLYLLDRSHKAQARIGERSSFGGGPPGPLRGGAIKRIAQILGIAIVMAVEGIIYGGGVTSVTDWMLMALVLVVAVLAARALKI